MEPIFGSVILEVLRAAGEGKEGYRNSNERISISVTTLNPFHQKNDLMIAISSFLKYFVNALVEMASKKILRLRYRLIKP